MNTGYKVFDTIAALVRLQGSATLTTIASCAEMPKSKVLAVLDKNAGLLHKHKNKITGAELSNPYAAMANARASGKVFWQEKISYGAAVALEWKNNSEADKLRTGYCCGGLGDWSPKPVLLDTPENREALEKLGMSDKLDPSEWPGFLRWEE